MNFFLHTCCTPCTIGSISVIQNEKIYINNLSFFWFNPNIHPFTEYRSRKNALCEFAKNNNFNLIVNENYGLREFVKNVAYDIELRCDYCYDVRMDMTAKTAKENGFDCFSTTLLISPYQNHEKVIQKCEEKSQKYGIKFLYIDFRTGFREGQQQARKQEIYMQKYCGCIFSEEDRYCK